MAADRRGREAQPARAAGHQAAVGRAHPRRDRHATGTEAEDYPTAHGNVAQQISSHQPYWCRHASDQLAGSNDVANGELGMIKGGYKSELAIYQKYSDTICRSFAPERPMWSAVPRFMIIPALHTQPLRQTRIR